MNIVLTGFMATGKSSVGKVLAQRLGWDYFDTDVMIENQTGYRVATIFSKAGEWVFRDLESKMVGLVALLDRAVISTGGGVPLDKVNMEKLEQNGRVFLLTATPENIVRRVQQENTSRPLLAEGKPLDRVKALLKERKAPYARCHGTVATDDVSVEEVADRVLALFQNPK